MSRLRAIIPNGCGPGTTFKVVTPSGQPMLVTVPPGLGPGMALEIIPPNQREPSLHESVKKAVVTVPPGCGPGSMFKATMPDGSNVLVTVPDGCGPGATLEVHNPRAATGMSTATQASAPQQQRGIPVIVPSGCFPGSQFKVHLPTGEQVLVTVPPGMQPGGTVEVLPPKREEASRPNGEGTPVDTTGDGKADAMGYDTTGDGKIDSLDTTGDGLIDSKAFEPDDAGENMYTAPQLERMARLALTVPAGVQAGQTMLVNSAYGQYKVVVPAGVNPGQQIQLQVPVYNFARTARSDAARDASKASAPAAADEADAHAVELDGDSDAGAGDDMLHSADMVILVGKLVKNSSRKGLFREGSAYLEARMEKAEREGPGRVRRGST